MPDFLLTFQVTSHDFCVSRYARFDNVEITDTKVCARDPDKSGSACQARYIPNSKHTPQTPTSFVKKKFLQKIIWNDASSRQSPKARTKHYSPLKFEKANFLGVVFFRGKLLYFLRIGRLRRAPDAQRGQRGGGRGGGEVLRGEVIHK